MNGAMAKAVAPFIFNQKRKPQNWGNGFPLSDNY